MNPSEPNQPYSQGTPNQQFDPSVNYGPPPVSPLNPGQSPDDDSDDHGSKKILIIVGAIAATVVVIGASLFGGYYLGKGSVPPAENNIQSSEGPGPQAANAIDVQQTNNSISQDLSSLNNDQDFPEDALSDKSLGL